MGIWKQLHRHEKEWAIETLLVLIGTAVVALLFAAFLLIIGITRLVEALRTQDSPYPGMSDAQFSRCVDISEKTLQARLMVERLGANPPPGTATDAALNRVEGLAANYAQNCSAKRWQAAFDAARAEGVPPALRAEDWIEIARR
ncbi:hypothetical protein ACA097_11440 [Pseudomonas sp. QL9]|uniref:hypothetical protein n=1 Tax=Pseudomonas sp. QL9 TaxID=3242725 RepID=UPI00352AC9C9